MKTVLLVAFLIFVFHFTAESKSLKELSQEIEELRARVTALETNNQPLSGTKPVNVTVEEDPILSPLAESGKLKFNTFCTACHKPNFETPMVAPPIAMVKDHYKQFYKDDKGAFIKAIVAWVKAPNTEKTLMPGAVRNFNIMPPFPLPDADLTAIATYLFEADIPQPTGFEKHVEEERRQLSRGPAE
jgi:mono/diheme cytochrome c family protein